MAVEPLSNTVRYSGSGANDNDVLFTTGDVSSCDQFMLMSTDGAVDVFASLDGTNFSSVALSLQDFGAVSLDPVQVTAADRIYGFAGTYSKLRVDQNGATASGASLLCRMRR